MDLSAQTLDDLATQCTQQLHRFKLVRDRDTSSCTEILRRAAHDQHTAAIEMLIRLSIPLVRTKCPLDLRDEIEDWLQEVLLLLSAKMLSRTSPYTVRPPPPDPFAAYRTFMIVTAHHFSLQVRLARQRQLATDSLDHLRDVAGYEPAQPTSSTAQVERMLVLERLLVLIREPLDREIFRLRFVRGLDPDETVVQLVQQGFPYVVKQDVFRSVERSIRVLSTLPEVREMFESAAGNDA
ncbi:MAG: hypothetical protein WCK70_01615 [Chloroflexales bacterium]